MSDKGILHDLKRATRTSETFDSAWERDYMLLLEGDETVRRWEKGICRPRPYLRVQMCGLVDGVGLGYREALLEVV